MPAPPSPCTLAVTCIVLCVALGVSVWSAHRSFDSGAGETHRYLTAISWLDQHARVPGTGDCRRSSRLRLFQRTPHHHHAVQWTGGGAQCCPSIWRSVLGSRGRRGTSRRQGVACASARAPAAWHAHLRYRDMISGPRCPQQTQSRRQTRFLEAPPSSSARFSISRSPLVVRACMSMPAHVMVYCPYMHVGTAAPTAPSIYWRAAFHAALAS